MHVINLTPHPVVIVDVEGNKKFTFKKSGSVARCVPDRVLDDSIRIGRHMIPVNRTMFTTVKGVPEEKEGVRFIVSKPVANALKGIRHDLLIPDQTIRDDNGVILGCRALAIIR